jgi:hypothetical protein
MADENESAKQDGSAPRAGHIEDVGMLDLRWAKTAEDIGNIVSMEDVGVVLIPEHLAGALGRVSMEDVGAIIPIPPGDNVNVMSGQVKLTGEMLAGGNPEAILVLVGQAHITTAVQSVGYKELRIYGQLYAPRGSEAAISGKLTQFSGQVFYLPANARTFNGNTTIGQAFLDLLPEPAALVVMGNLDFEADVTVEAVKAKIPEIVLMGNINAPKALIPLLQVLTREKMGEIHERKE